MSPEQLLGEDLNVHWDLWALAVTAYEALTGALPFSSPARADWRRAVLSGSFKPLSEHLDNPPEQWQTFFTRSLADDRTKRAKSAADFFRQLEHAFG
jgi:serine/threonine protein kinase